jgi:hypothetical protein
MLTRFQRALALEKKNANERGILMLLNMKG